MKPGSATRALPVHVTDSVSRDDGSVATLNQCQRQVAAWKYSLLAALMMIDMHGLDIQAVHEVKTLILESVSVWKNYKKRMSIRSSAGVN